MENKWRKNLVVLWIGCFFTGASFNLVMPFIPLYIEELGAPKSQVELYAGLAVSITAFASAIVAPIWGNLADRKGRKLMLIRAAAGMSLTMGALAFVPNVYWLLAMRFLNGVLAGYIPNSTAMVAAQTPEEKRGWSLGTLSTGTVAGMLIGPLIGGTMADLFGMKSVFLITSALLFITMVLTMFKVKEEFVAVEKKDMVPLKQIFRQIQNPSLLIGLFVTTLILQVGITSVTPILTLYIRELSGNIKNVLTISGLIVSVSGISAVISSPMLGRLGDKVGNQKVLLGGLLLSFLCIFPMAFVKTPLQLGLLRFLLGFSTGALMPSINTLISKLAPSAGVSRIYSYNQMFMNFGQVLGPLVGSIVAGAYGYSQVFLVTSLFIFGNVLLSFFNFRKLLKSSI